MSKRNSAAKKTTPKKAVPSKAGVRKTAAKKTATTKTAAKKTAVKKAATKKTAAKKTTAATAAAQKVAKKAPARKTASRKAAAGEAVRSKTVAKPGPAKPTSKKAVARRAAVGTHAPRPADAGREPSALIDARIRELGDWRGPVLARVRQLIHEADPQVVETWKWRGVPVWEHDGIICTGETYKDYVKLTFARGAALDDPARLFNASLEGNARRAIDIRVDDEPDAAALKDLVRAAVALNQSHGRRRGTKGA